MKTNKLNIQSLINANSNSAIYYEYYGEEAGYSNPNWGRRLAAGSDESLKGQISIYAGGKKPALDLTQELYSTQVTIVEECEYSNSMYCPNFGRRLEVSLAD